MITALAGGVGAARLLDGLVRTVDPREVTVIVNVGDDLEWLGLHVSPDIDIVMYTLAGIVDPEKGWGVREDSFNCLNMLSTYGEETWFKVGDRDLATHLVRTMLLKNGYTLAEAVDYLRRRLGVKAKIIPVTNDRLRTKVVSGGKVLDFQEYFVRLRTEVRVDKVFFEGADSAAPAPGVLRSIMEADGVVICPSNPIVSIGPILAVKGVRDALKRTGAVKVAVSPLVGGRALKGPADRMMRSLGLEPNAYGVAKLYGDFLDYMVIDLVDRDLRKKIEDVLGLKVVVTNTVMSSLEAKKRLAGEIVKIVRGSIRL